MKEGNAALEININGQPLKFTLEKENTLGEVIRGLETWLESSNLVVCSASGDSGPDGRDLLASQGWESLPIAEIPVLNVSVARADELLGANLRSVDEFLALLEQSLTVGEADGIEELMDGIPYLLESVRRQFSADLRSDLERLNRLLGETSAEAIAAWPQAVRAEALRLIALLRRQSQNRRRELEQPREVVRELAEELDHCGEAISDVSILLQTGRDREAMDNVIRFSDLSGRLARVIAFIQSNNHGQELLTSAGTPLPAFYRDLNKVLEELVQAFQSRDSVLIGDLLEYEIAPRLETLKTLVGDLL
jgi:hypothetical protein